MNVNRKLAEGISPTTDLAGTLLGVCEYGVKSGRTQNEDEALPAEMLVPRLSAITTGRMWRLAARRGLAGTDVIVIHATASAGSGEVSSGRDDGGVGNRASVK